MNEIIGVMEKSPKTALVTGASGGIGREASLWLARNNVHVIAVGRNLSALHDLQKENPAMIEVVAADLSCKDSFGRFPFCGFAGHLDILVNNAGALLHMPFENTDDEIWQRLLDVNFLAPVRAVRALLGHMGGDRHTHIVNIGSMGGFQGSQKFPGLSAYSAGKGALANLTETLAAEFQGRNISVNCLAFGSVNTEMLQKAFPGYVAGLSAAQAGAFVGDFSLNSGHLFNGKVLPVSTVTP